MLQLSNNGTFPMHAQVPDYQVRQYSDPLELRTLPYWSSLVHLRVSAVQTQDLPPLHRKVLKGSNLQADMLAIECEYHHSRFLPFFDLLQKPMRTVILI